MRICERSNGKRFLSGAMPPEAEAVFADHIANCVQCQKWLEEDSGDVWSWQMATHLIHAPQRISANEPYLYQIPTDLDSDASAINVDIASLAKSCLAPTDDPRFIGRLGAYEIAGVIGRGGMGMVLKAFEPQLNRFVAIKMLDPTLVNIGSARQRFAREAKSMAAIAHENVVPVYAVDQYQEIPYFVMEYVVGGTLESRLNREGPLDIASTIRIALQIADALAAADSQGLVHRDIKPANILIDRGTERVRVADFGLARVASEANETRSGMIAGTPQYMSPEQVRGINVDSRSDLFSLGSVMYAMCTGHSPFRADGIYAVMQRIVHDHPRSLRHQNASIPEWLEHFVFRLLAKAPEARFQSAGQVASILRQELAHLQNPTRIAVPGRSWFAPEKTVVPPAYSSSASKSTGNWISACLAIASLIIASTVVLYPRAISPRPDEATTQKTKTEIQANNQPPTAIEQPPFDPGILWETDGSTELQARIHRLGESVSAAGIPSPDTLDLRYSNLKSRLRSFRSEPF